MRGGVETAIDGQGGAFADGGIEMAGDTIPMLARDQRAHFAGRLRAGANLDAGDAFPNGVDERAGDIADGEHDRDGHAALAGRAVAGGDSGIGSHGDVRIGQDQHMILCAAKCLHALAVARGVLIDVAGNGRGTDEADGADAGCSRSRSTATLSP